MAPGDSTVELPAIPLAARDLSLRWISELYWFHHDRADGLLYAQINQIGNAERAVRLDQDTARVTLREFGQRILERIDSGQVKTLVLDIRRNGGGNNYLIRPLVQGLAARPAINQRGRLFVITGRRTYSAAMNFTSLLEERTQAIFVGEPPGGAPSHYGDATGFQLPVSGMQLNVSTLHWDLGVAPNDVREEQEPEIFLAPRIADRVAGRDPALAAILAWRPGTSLAEQLTDRFRRAGIDSAVALARSSVPGGSDPWSSRVQQLTRFGSAVIDANGGAAIYRAYELATELYPDSPYAWFELSRVYRFGNRRIKDAGQAIERARALRPTSDLIVRTSEAVRRQQPR